MRIRNLVIAAGVVAVLLGVIGAVALSRIDLNQHVAFIEAKAKEATGRELKIKGDVGFKLSLFPTVAANDVTFQNARWGSRPHLASAKRIEAQVALLPLLAGNVVISRLELVEPDVVLEINARGERNWDFAKPGAAKDPRPPGDGGAAVEVREVRVARGAFAFRRAAPKVEHQARIDVLDLDVAPGYDEIEIDGKGTLNGIPVALNGSIDNLKQAGKAGATGAVELEAAAGGSTLKIAGSVPLGGGLAGLDARFSADVPDSAALRTLLRTPFPPLPPAKVKGRARVAKDALAIEDLEAQAGKSRARGQLQMGLTGERREIRALLDAPLIDLQELYAGSGKAGATPARGDGRVFSNDPLPVAALKALEGKAEMRIEKLRLADGRLLEGIGARAAFRRGKIDGEEIKLRLDGRELRLDFAADASSGKDLAVNATVAGEKVPLAALTGLLGVTAAPEGALTDIAVKLAGRGASVRALMASANGDVRVVVGPGRIKSRAIDRGADVTELLNALNPARAQDEYTELRCMVLRFPVRNGIATIDNGIALETSKVRVLGGGTVNLRDETLELGFRPKATTGLGVGAGNLARFAKVGGTLADPKIALDMASAAAGAAAAGAAVLTGGLSLLVGGGLLVNDVPDDVCQVALSGAPKAAPKQEPGGSIFDPIKKLFGN
ncbi:MAG: AsmA family protein [Pseudomonadota bacterium]